VSNSGTRSSAAELLIQLDRSQSVSLRTQLEHRLRELIRSGALSAGAVLPASRTLATDLGVSRRLVVDAYEQLIAEGYLAAEERSVTRVGNVSTPTASVPAAEERPKRHNLRPGVPALAEFPRSAWLRATARVLTRSPDSALAYPDPRGAVALRRAIAAYLRRVRAVVAEPDQVVICAGFTQALSLIVRAGGIALVALEDPGLVGRDQTVAVAGGSHIAIPVDGLGLRTELLHASAANAVVVAPAHQFPLGVTLAPLRRSELLSWAATGDRIVVEDDYDAEFRYDRQPVGALQGLAPERVAYIGTVSKTLAPALRLGWIVPPNSLLDAVVAAKHNHDAGSPTLDQLVLAELFETGVYERHLRRMRKYYRRSRDALIAALQEQLPDVQIGGTAAGLHLIAVLPDGIHASAVVRASAARDLAVEPLDRHVLRDGTGGDNRLVLGYGNIAHATIDAAVCALADAIDSARPAPRTRSN